jgi:hypothetical protein
LLDTDGTTRITAAREGSRLNVEVDGVKRSLGSRPLPLDGVPPVEAVQVNGVAFDRVDGLEIDADAATGWTYDPKGILRATIG